MGKKRQARASARRGAGGGRRGLTRDSERPGRKRAVQKEEGSSSGVPRRGEHEAPCHALKTPPMPSQTPARPCPALPSLPGGGESVRGHRQEAGAGARSA